MIFTEHMLQKINYEDDTFYLLLMLKRMHDGLKLDIDPEYFLDKVVDDIFFADEVISTLYSNLRRSSILRKAEYIRNIHRVKRLMVDLIDNIVHHRIPLSNNIAEFLDSLKNIVEIHRRDIRDIRKYLASVEDETTDDELMVSERELKFLFSKNDEK